MKTDQTFLNNLYTIKSTQVVSVNKLTVEVEINREHDIFNGHFPGNPILPGVCTIQILKEILKDHFDKEVNLVKAVNIKYLSFINPDKNSVIDYDIELKDLENGNISCNANIHFEELVFCSFKGEFSSPNCGG
jgi:3-hydroxyacyl-[acyl-carrier-protein] dehydratase